MTPCICAEGALVVFTTVKKAAVMAAVILLLAAVSCAGSSPDPSSAPVNTEPLTDTAIVFGDLNWNSVIVQNHIAQFIVEEGYGYSTENIFGGTLPILQGLRRGDVHIAMEVWLPNQPESWDEGLAEGAVFSAGQSLGHDWQSAFVIPAYLQEQYPELNSVEDLKDPQYRKLFAETGTGGRARLVSCVIGWACDAANSAQIEGYGLSEHVNILNPGSGAALNDDLYGAYERQEPWLGYQWGTNEPALRLDLVRLQEPFFSERCWATTQACAYADSTIIIGVNSVLRELAPDVVAMLEKWDFDINAVYKPLVRWQQENPDASGEETALWWLSNHPDVWSQWVTEEAESSIRAALEMGPAP